MILQGLVKREVTELSELGTEPCPVVKVRTEGYNKLVLFSQFACVLLKHNTETLTHKHTVIIRCQPLTQPSNGVVSISTGTHGVNLGVGAIATYSCNSGYGLVGQASRTCVSGGGTTGTWSGTQPTCEGKNLHSLHILAKHIF